jgi:hypothetical protein
MTSWFDEKQNHSHLKINHSCVHCPNQDVDFHKLLLLSFMSSEVLDFIYIRVIGVAVIGNSVEHYY